jgi:hypothetical protein
MAEALLIGLGREDGPDLLGAWPGSGALVGAGS